MINIPLISNNQIKLERLLNKWKEIKQNVKDDPTYRPITLRAWNRCENYQIKPDNLEYIYLSKKKFKKKRKENMVLIDTAKPYMKNLSRGFVNIPHVIGLSDKNNWLIEGEGSEEILKQESDIRPGVNMSEQYIGNNGNGTPLLEKKPVLIYDCEHFGEQKYSTACFGVPIRNNKKNIIGVLSISVPLQFSSPERLLIMLSSAKSIEREFGLKNNNIDIISQNIGNKIKKIRERNNLTQKDLAERSDLAQSYISDIENENKSPTLRTLKLISNALNIYIMELIEK